MRFAALAFGVVAGLVASLILALGGLDPTMLAHFDPRQLSLLRFGLFVVANLGVLGAGVVLAAPLAGIILFGVGAVAWVLAAVLLRHGPDYVLITPPVLLLAAFGFALVAFLRRPQRRAVDRYYDDDEEAASPIRAAMSDQEPDENGPAEEEEPAGTPVRAGFFGQGGTGMPARVEAGVPSQPALSGYDDEPDDIRARDDNWRPGSRRPPPRQKPMFRDEDEDDEDETGFSRFARGFSSVASFGLYAALAGAAVLVFVNWRNFDGTATPAAARIDARSSSAVAVVSAPPPAAPILSGSSSSGPTLVAVTEPPSLPATNLITAAPTLGDSPLVAPAPATLANTAASEPIPSPGGLVVADTPPPATPSLPTLASPGADAPPPADEPAVTPTIGTPANPMPFQMLPEMAAERAKATPTAAVPATPKTAAPKPAAPKPAAPKSPATKPAAPKTTAPAPKADAGI